MKKYIIVNYLTYKSYKTLDEAKDMASDGQQILEISNEWSVDVKKTLIGGGNNGKTTI